MLLFEASALVFFYIQITKKIPYSLKQDEIELLSRNVI